MKKLFLLSIFATTMSLCLLSQTVVVYDTYNTDKTINLKKVKQINNKFQWDFSALTFGAFVITYERKINNYFGVEAGAGPTFFPSAADMLFNVFKNLFDAPSSYNYKAGYFLSASAKVYPTQMADFDGFYISPSYRHRAYNYRAAYAPSKKLSSNTSDFAFIIGYQYQGWLDIMWNFYAGFMWWMKKADYVVESGYDNETFKYKYSVDKNVKLSGPGLVLGVSLGFVF